MNQVDFIRLEDEIKLLLIDDPKTRNDDMYLYACYCLKKVQNTTNQINSFYLCFVDKDFRKEYGVCTFTAVIRTRRKIQVECPELESERMKQARAKEEEEYKEYARA